MRENQLNYWQKRLAAAPALLHLPTDYPRPLEQSFQGDRIKCILSPELSQGLNKLSREKGVTLFMTLLTAISDSTLSLYGTNRHFSRYSHR
ncbi:MAG UNVERIFIED_CONTAM: condensation domain-containing protein [Microcystis novacekii LVE1205-3]|jgi:hypothetical protein